jgi:enhancer of yellow 2 transcription factor
MEAAADRDAEVRETIHQKLQESGEKERLKELLRKRLYESGWHDDLKAYCKEVIKAKGLESITVEDLVKEITPHGRSTVPDSVKAELLSRIQHFVTSK